MDIEKKYLVNVLPKEKPPFYGCVITAAIPKQKFFAICDNGEKFSRSEAKKETSKEVLEILWPASEETQAEKTSFKIIICGVLKSVFQIFCRNY